MKPFIYTKRNGIHILDLQITTRQIDEAHAYIHELVKAGKKILFVGTKKQAQEAVAEEAAKCGMYYVNKRWLGGLLTNYPTIKKRVDRLRELRKKKADGYFETVSKKDARALGDEMAKLEKFLGGIANMDGLPDVLFIIDVKKETNAVAEAKKLKIPIIGIVDSNCDPDDVNVKILGNDDAIRSIKLFCSIVADSVLEAKNGFLPPDSVFVQAAAPTAETAEVSIEEIVEKTPVDLAEAKGELEVVAPAEPEPGGPAAPAAATDLG
jgi:small subunit ribosomal protein S2